MLPGIFKAAMLGLEQLFQYRRKIKLGGLYGIK